MCMQNPHEQILVATSMNLTADLVSEALYKIEAIRKKICRIYSTTREDIFNVNIQELPEWSIIYKMLYDTEQLDEYTKENTQFDEEMMDDMTDEQIYQAVKFQVEYYFGQTNYYKDDYLQKAASKEGWILLEIIFGFRSIQKFHDYLHQDDLFELLKLSSIVEVKEDIRDFGDGDPEVVYYIRKKEKKLQNKYVNFFGYNIETIKQLSIKQFETFMKHKRDFEKKIFESMPVIVTTIGKACTQQLRQREFKRIVMDEATMIKENEAFLSSTNAQQIVLVGD